MPSPVVREFSIVTVAGTILDNILYDHWSTEAYGEFSRFLGSNGHYSAPYARREVARQAPALYRLVQSIGYPRVPLVTYEQVLAHLEPVIRLYGEYVSFMQPEPAQPPTPPTAPPTPAVPYEMIDTTWSGPVPNPEDLFVLGRL